MTLQTANFLTQKFGKILTQGFCPRPNLNTTLTESLNPLEKKGYKNMSTVDTP
jgi:hypothetical protein